MHTHSHEGHGYTITGIIIMSTYVHTQVLNLLNKLIKQILGAYIAV